MKKIIFIILQLLIMFIYYYLWMPAINIHSMGFWAFILFSLIIFFILSMIYTSSEGIKVLMKGYRKKNNFHMAKVSMISCVIFGIIFIIMLIINFFSSPVFNASSYANRIIIEYADFSEDIEEVDFNSLPLLDRDSSMKLGDRVMGKMSNLVSQFYVSDDYTQINYNNDIVRVTPLEYAGFIKWIANKKEGVPSYIIVNSTNGKSEMVNLEKGMKYMPSAYFNYNLTRHLRLSYPFTNFGTSKFEIDNDGNPYFITPTISYTGIGLKAKITGVIITDPVTGDNKRYDISEIPSWVDNAFFASLLIEQIDDWGAYKNGFINSIFGQKEVIMTTDGYNYLAMDDDVFMYTGITSVLSDESNLGFVLSNLRTGETKYYEVAGAEEYSAMDSAMGQVQQMNYTSTFPLLINLKGKPTYLVSLKDNAGLVKMYGFIDVEDYQKVVVTDSSLGIEKAKENYLNTFGSELSNSDLIKKEIEIRNIFSAVIDGNTYYYIVDKDNNRYRASIKISSKLPFIKVGDNIKVSYVDGDIREIKDILE